MIKETANKRVDELQYLYSVLKRLGCGDVETFRERIMSQKVQYFAQLFGVTYRYKFNLYLRGPYSPSLATDLYTIKQEKITPMREKFIPIELEKRFTDLKKFVRDMDPRQLELAATMHWLLRVANYPEIKAKEVLAEIKGADDNEINAALDKVSEYDEIKKGYI